MRRQLLPALGMLLVFVITGLAYPLVVTGSPRGYSQTRPMVPSWKLTGRWWGRR